MSMVILAIALSACGGDGRAEIQTTTTAPFALSGDAALFSTDPANDGQRGSAVLVLTDSNLDCESLTANAIGDGLDEIVLKGQGLLLFLQYDRDNFTTEDFDLTGLWMAGYAYNMEDTTEKSMGALAFSDGYIYMSPAMYYGLTGDWLQIDNLGSSVSGSFSTVWWSGTFNAKNCGDWTASAESDTGYGY